MNLPLVRLSNYYYSAVMKKPALTLSTNQSKVVAQRTGDGILVRLDGVNSESQFDAMKPALIKHIETLDISPEQKTAINSLINGPFIVRKGSPNAAFKIRASLKSSHITESFDKRVQSILGSTGYDEDDFKLDMIEVFARRK